MAFRPSIGGPFWWNAGILAGPSGRFGGVKQQEVIPEGSLAEYVEVGEIIGTLLLYRYCYVDLYLYIYIYTLRYFAIWYCDMYTYTQILCYWISLYIYIFIQILQYDIMTHPPKTYLRILEIVWCKMEVLLCCDIGRTRRGLFIFFHSKRWLLTITRPLS